MKYIILILISIFAASPLFAQSELAIINDKDGFTNLRAKQNGKSKVLRKIKKDELFYCEETDSDWWEAVYYTYKTGEIVGYIHKSRVQLFYDLPAETQKKRINTILVRQKKLALESNRLRALQIYKDGKEAWPNEADRVAYEDVSKKRRLHQENKYETLLNSLPDYFCEQQDGETLQLLFELFDAEWETSCLETPTTVSADIFVCNPKLIAKLIPNIKNPKTKNFIIETIDYGLETIFQEDDAEYASFKKKLDGVWVVKR
ncbi:MAG: hypothetical protein KAH48_00770 [Chlorobi bacterium]|nr:hypothetical protein [Chlorobiota bacterium]